MQNAWYVNVIIVYKCLRSGVVRIPAKSFNSAALIHKDNCRVTIEYGCHIDQVIIHALT